MKYLNENNRLLLNVAMGLSFSGSTSDDNFNLLMGKTKYFIFVIIIQDIKIFGNIIVFKIIIISIVLVMQQSLANFNITYIISKTISF